MKEDTNVFAYKRLGEEETLLVLCNFSSKIINMKNQPFIHHLESAEIIITNEQPKTDIFFLHPYEATVYKIKN